MSDDGQLTLAEMAEAQKAALFRFYTEVAYREILKQEFAGPGAPRGASSLHSVSLGTALTDYEVLIEGDRLLAATSNGTLAGISVKFNDTSQDAFELDKFNDFQQTFKNIYITSGAQSGATLRLYVGGEADAEASLQDISAYVVQKFSVKRSDKDTHFTGALAQYVKEDENLTGLLVNKIRITGIALQSDQNLNYRVLFWKTDGFDDTDLDLDTFCGDVELDLPSYGFQIGGAGQYYLDMRGLDLDYIDADETKELHISLMNLSATAKNAGATGEVVVEIYYELRA